MAYQPTKEELEEIGITNWKNHSSIRLYNGETDIDVTYYPIVNQWEIYVSSEEATFNFYPKSKSDIETLIRLFTNN